MNISGREIWSIGLLGIFLLSAPPVGATDDEGGESERARLERTLRPGQPRDFYREQLADSGWTVTAVNRDDSDYVEYEIVRGERTYEVHLHMDADTDRATEV